nr:MAG TPA: hypothetical protein [Inoviridae sp.]
MSPSFSYFQTLGYFKAKKKDLYRSFTYYL